MRQTRGSYEVIPGRATGPGQGQWQLHGTVGRAVQFLRRLRWTSPELPLVQVID
ncbi:hypothetical protein ABZ918_16995 [Streptomyces viridosporus]|uniref:hypothetical protein n=1 Tax=Streptomyces viridosporus TaxID=67581 RepID=UPI001319C644|nr:hypothetical protein [Streptomyces viridosporus]